MSFVTPHPDDDDRVRFYQDAGYFDEIYREAALPRALRAVWERSRLRLADPWRRPGARLLEAGCGRGTFLAAAVAAGWDATGVELGDAASRAASRRAGVTVHSGTIDTPRFDDAWFDVVAAWDVIEHVPDPAAFLAECRRVLRPGGGLLLSCPNVSTWPPKLLKGRWWTLKPNEHLWHFEPRTLRTALVDAGFRPHRLVTSPIDGTNLARFDSLVAVASA